MKWLSECRLDIGVAAIAELRLRHLEKVFLGLGFMHAVATCAANIGFAVCRVRKIRMRTSMAGQALRIDDSGQGFAELEDLCRVAACFHVRLAGPMATFTGNAFAAMQ